MGISRERNIISRERNIIARERNSIDVFQMTLQGLRSTEIDFSPNISYSTASHPGLSSVGEYLRR